MTKTKRTTIAAAGLAAGLALAAIAVLAAAGDSSSNGEAHPPPASRSLLSLAAPKVTPKIRVERAVLFTKVPAALRIAKTRLPRQNTTAVCTAVRTPAGTLVSPASWKCKLRNKAVARTYTVTFPTPK